MPCKPKKVGLGGVAYIYVCVSHSSQPVHLQAPLPPPRSLSLSLSWKVNADVWPLLFVYAPLYLLSSIHCCSRALLAHTHQLLHCRISHRLAKSLDLLHHLSNTAFKKRPESLLNTLHFTPKALSKGAVFRLLFLVAKYAPVGLNLQALTGHRFHMLTPIRSL